MGMLQIFDWFHTSKRDINSVAQWSCWYYRKLMYAAACGPGQGCAKIWKNLIYSTGFFSDLRLGIKIETDSSNMIVFCSYTFKIHFVGSFCWNFGDAAGWDSYNDSIILVSGYATTRCLIGRGETPNNNVVASGDDFVFTVLTSWIKYWPDHKSPL